MPKLAAMLDKVLIAELLQELSVKDAPLTTVAAGAFTIISGSLNLADGVRQVKAAE